MTDEHEAGEIRPDACSVLHSANSRDLHIWTGCADSRSLDASLTLLLEMPDWMPDTPDAGRPDPG